MKSRAFPQGTQPAFPSQTMSLKLTWPALTDANATRAKRTARVKILPCCMVDTKGLEWDGLRQLGASCGEKVYWWEVHIIILTGRK